PEMDSCDVLIVGGGPAGSSCAWNLRNSGLRIAILDKQLFPRHKVCGGWITPAVLDALQIEPSEYAQGRTLQPITGFRTSYIGGPEPELYFCSDMKGYGWCFRKHNILNVGLGRLDQRQLSKHVGEFLKFLKAAGKLPLDAPPALGHAYLLFGVTPRNMVGEGV